MFLLPISVSNRRKRSSDSTPEPGIDSHICCCVIVVCIIYIAVTVVEQIVHQLTEKRVKELSSAIVDTRKEYW